MSFTNDPTILVVDDEMDILYGRLPDERWLGWLYLRGLQ